MLITNVFQGSLPNPWLLKPRVKLRMTLANWKLRTALHVQLGPFPTSPLTWIHGIHFKEMSVLTNPWTWTCGIHVKERSVLTNSLTWTHRIHVREGSAPTKWNILARIEHRPGFPTLSLRVQHQSLLYRLC